MRRSKKISKKQGNPIHILSDIEDVHTVLSEIEIRKLHELYSTFDNFNEITENIERNIVNNDLKEKDLLTMYKLVSKLSNYREELNLVYTEVKSKMGLTRSFFELPEIISRRLLKDK